MLALCLSLSMFPLCPTAFTSSLSHGWWEPWGRWGKVSLSSLRAGTTHNGSLCISQTVPPYHTFCVSICHSGLYRLLVPKAPEKSVPCKGLNSGLQSAGGAAWPEDQADILSAKTSWKAQQQQMFCIRKAFAYSAVYSSTHVLKANFICVSCFYSNK